MLKGLINAISGDSCRNTINDTLQYILNIFRAIKKAEDAVGVSKTPKLHMLADIGVLIVNALSRNGMMSSITPPGTIILPLSFYKVSPDEKKHGESSNCSLRCPFDESFIERVLYIFETQPNGPPAQRGRDFQGDSLQLKGASKDSEPKSGKDGFSSSCGSVITIPSISGRRDSTQDLDLVKCTNSEANKKAMKTESTAEVTRFLETILKSVTSQRNMDMQVTHKLDNASDFGLQTRGWSKPDHEWMRCDRCRKWRTLRSGSDNVTLPKEWYWYMRPTNSTNESDEQKLGHSNKPELRGSSEISSEAEEEDCSSVEKVYVRKLVLKIFVKVLVVRDGKKGFTEVVNEPLVS
ncbi:hypothetical protein GIB67_035991 [Kingdonia uniflora]|uniref:CW-type domain-containing protein n=1 Tax=Kingdonia uniflora TaxID=39325 RepID=A0A7J7N184_9MAGN|nr:hypothetical protein GIB67_035991 [Kingdonia uniflora]